MSFLKPGTLCITVGGSGENAGRIVRVIRYTGPHKFDSRVVEGYLVETVSGRLFTSVKEYEPEEIVSRLKYNTCTADRKNLRPLVDIEEALTHALEAEAVMAPLVDELLRLMKADDSEALMRALAPVQA